MDDIFDRDLLDRLSNKVSELEADNKRLKEEQRISNSCVPCMYLGGDCCGMLYWSSDGKILCNECNKEFEITLIGDKSN